MNQSLEDHLREFMKEHYRPFRPHLLALSGTPDPMEVTQLNVMFLKPHGSTVARPAVPEMYHMVDIRQECSPGHNRIVGFELHTPLHIL